MIVLWLFKILLYHTIVASAGEIDSFELVEKPKPFRPKLIFC